MTQINGDPAFAALAVTPAGDVFRQEGMSLRDWFAGQALAVTAAMLVSGDLQANDGGSITPLHLAGEAYEIADAMIAAREKGGAL